MAEAAKLSNPAGLRKRGEVLRYEGALRVVDAEEPGEKQAILYAYDDVVADTEMLEILAGDGKALDGVAVAP